MCPGGLALLLPFPEGRRLQLNPALLQMLGGTQEQLAAMTLMDLAWRDVGADGALPALGRSGEPQATFGE